jgi:hypothetical protein
LTQIIGLALGFNVIAWIGAWLWPASGSNGVWAAVSLLGAVLTGALIGRWWALLVMVAFVLIHAIPVYFGWLPGYLSTWEEALWWGFALLLLLALTSLGVLSRAAVRWVRSRFAR